MRKLTFEGYLESYVQGLAGKQTTSLAQLAAVTESEPRLVEPLVLWAVTTGRWERLSKLCAECADRDTEMRAMFSLWQQGCLESALASEDPSLRPEYSKVWRSYVARRDASVRDAQLKSAARARALSLEATKTVTRYRMAKDLGLNPGNLHAYLAQGNVSKLSLDRAYALVDYLKAA
ncbi:MAG: transcriptional regulator [Coriobacteriia bacterium]